MVIGNTSVDQTALDLPICGGLYELQHRIAENDGGKWDLTVPRDRLALSGGRLILPEEFADEYPDEPDVLALVNVPGLPPAGHPGPLLQAQVPRPPCKTPSSTTGPGGRRRSRTRRNGIPEPAVPNQEGHAPLAAAQPGAETVRAVLSVTATPHSTTPSCWHTWPRSRWNAGSRCVG